MCTTSLVVQTTGCGYGRGHAGRRRRVEPGVLGAGRPHQARDPGAPGPRRRDGEPARRAVRDDPAGGLQAPKVLERARLISRTRTAQSRPCVLDTERLDAAAGWIARHRQIWADRHDRLDEHLAALQPTRRTGGRHDDRDRRAHLPARAPSVARAALRLHDHARAPHPLLGSGRDDHAGRQHHRRPAARRRLRDHHGQ